MQIISLTSKLNPVCVWEDGDGLLSREPSPQSDAFDLKQIMKDFD